MEKETLIYPTHTCFDDSLDYLDALYHKGKKFHHLILVHAICQPKTNQIYVHSWVEDLDKNSCIFAGIINGEKYFFEADREEYRKGLNILDETRYSIKQAAEENNRTNSYGPWKKEYLEIIKKGKLK